jgi:hypothetical protein
MRFLRIAALIFGIPILLIGVCWITIDAGGEIGNALNKNPNLRVIRTFPMGTLCGVPCMWLGYRLVFTKPVKPSLPDLKRSNLSN